MAGVGPMVGQAHHIPARRATPKIEYGIKPLCRTRPSPLRRLDKQLAIERLRRRAESRSTDMADPSRGTARTVGHTVNLATSPTSRRWSITINPALP